MRKFSDIYIIVTWEEMSSRIPVRALIPNFKRWKDGAYEHIILSVAGGKTRRHSEIQLREIPKDEY